MGHLHIKDEVLADITNAAPGYHRWFIDVADGMPKLRDSAGVVTSLQGPPGAGGSLPTGTGLVEVTGGILVAGARAIGAASATDILSRSAGDARYYALGGALGTPLSGDLSNCTFPVLNQSTTGNALTASALQTGRNINGVFFDGTANITVPAAAATLTGTTLPALIGTALTALNASNLSSGTVAPARLGSGSGGATKFLREDSTFQNIPGGGDALVANPLSQFAATTSAQLAGVISDETGSGALVFATSPTLVTPALGTPASGNLTNCTFPTLNQDTTGYAEALKSATTTVSVSAATAPTSGQVLTATSGTAATWQTPSGGGSKNVFFPAAAKIPRTTTGCGINSAEFATNKQNIDVLEFDAAIQEFANIGGIMPDNWDLGTVTARVVWTAASGSGDVVWGVQARMYADGDLYDQAWGTAQTVTDTLGTANSNRISPATAAITIGGTLANGNYVIWQVYRDAAAGGDTLGVDAQLVGIHVTYT